MQRRVSTGAPLTEELYIRFVALLAAAMLVPAVVFAALATSHPEMRFWRISAGAMAALFCASLLSALRDVIPTVTSTLLANILVGYGYFLALSAVRSLNAKAARRMEDRALFGAYVCLALFVNLAANTYEHRVILVSGGIVVFSAAIILQLVSIRNALSPLGFLISVSACALNIFLAAMRGTSAWLSSETYFFSLSLWDPVFFVGSIAIVFGVSLGYFIMGSSIISERTEALLSSERDLTQQLNAAIDDQRNLQKLLLHEIKRPINALAAGLQAHASHPESGTKGPAPQNLLHIANEAGAFLEAIGQYDELSSLFDSPTKIPLSVSSVIDDLRSKWQVNIYSELAGKMPTIIADPLLIDIALGNLIENAQKFGRTTAKTKIHIHADATYLFFDIEDDGPGIPPGQADKVWRKFYRIGEASENAVKGCGLGLHAVASIAKAHNGYATVLSQVPSRLRFAIAKREEDV
jgi:signal transduction histidine kinase